MFYEENRIVIQDNHQIWSWLIVFIVMKSWIQLHDFSGAPVAQWVKHKPTDLAALNSSPTRGKSS